MRVVDHAVVQGHAHVTDGGVAAQVLVRQEEDLLTLLEGPVEGALGVGGGADRAAVLAGERLDVGGGVHVRHRDHLLGDARLGQHVPALRDLLGRRHVGHGAAGGEVGQDDLLVVGGQDVRRLGHEVHTAEDDVLGLRARGRVPGQLEGVTRDVRELDDLVTLVVVAEDEDLVAEPGLGGAGTLDQVGVGGRREVSGTLDAPLALRVGLAAEQQQGERSRLHVELRGLGGGHDTHPFYFSSN